MPSSVTHEILREAIVSNGGEVFQIVGDAFCAAFPTVLSAVSASIAAQEALHREQWDLPFPVRVRMGIHTGEAERKLDGDYASGPTLNRVARILNAAHGGQILVSLATKDLVKDSLPANTELHDMGEHYLRNLMYPEHLFQLNIAGLISDFPPLNTLTHRHNLPVQVTSFIAREREIALVHEYVGLAAPRFVNGYFELPIVLILCALMMLAVMEYRTWRITLAVSWAVGPPGVPRVAVEAGVSLAWAHYLEGDNGTVVGLNRFGASAPYKTLYAEFGLTPENVAEKAKKVVALQKV